MFARQLQIAGTVYACDIRLEAEEANGLTHYYKEDVIIMTSGIDQIHAEMLDSWMKQFNFTLCNYNFGKHQQHFIFSRYILKIDADIAYAAIHNYMWTPSRYDPALWKR